MTTIDQRPDGEAAVRALLAALAAGDDGALEDAWLAAPAGLREAAVALAGAEPERCARFAAAMGAALAVTRIQLAALAAPGPVALAAVEADPDPGVTELLRGLPPHAQAYAARQGLAGGLPQPPARSRSRGVRAYRAGRARRRARASALAHRGRRRAR